MAGTLEGNFEGLASTGRGYCQPQPFVPGYPRLYVLADIGEDVI